MIEEVELDISLINRIDDYLNSERAKSKGLKSREDAVIEAIKRFLEEEGF